MNPSAPLPSAAPGDQAVLEDYFARWREAFVRGCAAAAADRVFALAGNHLRLRFSGAYLRSVLTPALSHLPDSPPNRQADLEVWCWNGSDSSAPPPAPPWRWPPEWRQGANFCPAGQKNFQVSVLSDTGDFALYRADTNQAILWVRDARTLAAQHHGAPLLALFASWANHHNLMIVHAGCVGTDRGAALLVGKGGSGKSTTCLLCAEAGLDYLSDDYCLVGLSPAPTAFSLYCSGKLLRPMLPSFPRLAALAVEPSPDPAVKPVIYLRPDHGYAVTSQRPLRALVVPVVTGQADTSFAPTSAAQAMLALAPSTLYQLPNSGDGAFQSLARLVRTLPCYRLNLGTRFESIPPAVRALLASLP